MNEWLYTQPAGTIVGILFCLLLVASEIGARLGLRASKRELEAGDSQGLAIEAAILTLFGLLLGFTFSMSAGRYEARILTSLEEANAIGTAYLRTEVLPSPEGTKMRQALRGYLDARVEYYQSSFGSPALQKATENSDRFQKEAWAMAIAESKARPTAISAVLLTAMNDVIDLREKQQVIFENTVPQTVLWFLFGLSILVIAVIGYMNGVHGQKRLALSILFCVVVTMTLFLVLDLDRPRRGMIRLSHESLLRLKQSLAVQ